MLLGTDPFFDGAVILLQDAVQILNRSMVAARSQDSFFLRFKNRRRITLGLIGVDHPRLRVRRVRQRLGKQYLGRIGGTNRRQEKVDRGSRRVDRAIQ